MNGLAKFFKWLCAIVLSLTAIVYLSYRIYWDFIQPVDTSTIYEYKVSLSTTARGIAVRDETALEDALTGIEYYPHEDGSRVAVGEVVAELRRGGYVQSDERRHELEREIELLQEAQTTAVDYTNTQVFNRDIKQSLGAVSSMASAGRYEQLSDLRQSLTVGYNKKMISGGKALDYRVRLEQLQNQLSSMERSTAETAATISAPESGYFSSVVDGLEGLLRREDLEDLTVEEAVAIIDRGAPNTASRAGKMVQTENWTFVAAVPDKDLEWINELMIDASRKRVALQVQIAFDRLEQTVPATVKKIVQQKDSDMAVLLLESNWMNEEIINLRVEDAQIHFREYTGLRIDTSDLRFRTNSQGAQERGVYILRNNKVYFRLVDPIYEESGFLLSRSYYTAQEYIEPQRQQWNQDHPEDEELEVDIEPSDPTLEEEEADVSYEAEEDAFAQNVKRYVIMFDQVITKGNDLYHEKVLRDY